MGQATLVDNFWLLLSLTESSMWTITNTADPQPNPHQLMTFCCHHTLVLATSHGHVSYCLQENPLDVEMKIGGVGELVYKGQISETEAQGGICIIGLVQIRYRNQELLISNMGRDANHLGMMVWLFHKTPKCRCSLYFIYMNPRGFHLIMCNYLDCLKYTSVFWMEWLVICITDVSNFEMFSLYIVYVRKNNNNQTFCS